MERGKGKSGCKMVSTRVRKRVRLEDIWEETSC